MYDKLKAFITAIVALLFLPGITSLEHKMLRTDSERKIAETRERLTLDLKLIRKSAVVEIQLGTWLLELFESICESAPDNRSQLKQIDTVLQETSLKFDNNFSWKLFSFKDSTLSHHSLSDLKLVLTGGKAGGFASDLFRGLLMKGISSLSDKPISSEVYHYLKYNAKNQLDDYTAHNQTEVLRASMGKFEPVSIKNKAFFICWVPLFKKGWHTSSRRFEKIDFNLFDKRQFNRSFLNGIALVYIEKKDLNGIIEDATIFALEQSMRKKGCNLEFKEVFDETDGFEAVEFDFCDRKDGYLAAFSGLKIGERLFRVKASRKIASFVNLHRFSKPVGFVLKTLWIVGVIYFCGSFLLLGRSLKTGLAVQLLLFVIWLLFPVFYASYCLMERNVIEKQSAAMSQLKIKMERVAASFDDSLMLYKTWVCQKISATLHDSLAAYGPDTANRLEEMLKYIHSNLLKYGIYSKNVFLLDSSLRIRSIFTGADKKQVDLIQRFFSSIYSSEVANQGSGKNGSDILAGAQTEELISIARTLLSAEVISRLSMKDESLETLEAFGDKAYIYHKYYSDYKIAGNKQSILHVGIYKPSLQRICMLDWLDHFYDPDLSGLEWIMANRLQPTWFYRYPFWQANTKNLAGMLTQILDFVPAELAFYTQVSASAAESFTAHVEYNKRKYLLTCFSGANMNDCVVSLLFPLENHFRKIDRFRSRIWLAMGMILLLCVFIGVWLASGFVNPVKSFSKKAIAVTESNFSQKMEISGQDQEITSLAIGFNKVVENLQEGRTLKKFVSEDTLEALPVISKTKLSPEKVRAVILFAGLENFSQASIDTGPQEAVAELNEFFALICRLLNNSGGDVSKFIGEKVLVVFKVPSGSSDTEIAGKVIKFVRQLVKKQRKRKSRLKNIRLKIGITAGDVLSGIIGGDNTRLEQTVTGDKVNLAARLCSFKSSETVLTDQNFAQLLKELDDSKVSIKQLPDQKIKGKKAMVALFSLQI